MDRIPDWRGEASRIILAPMALPRPAGPRALWADLRAFWRERPRHQYAAAVLAVLIPIGIIVAFYVDGQTRLQPVQTRIYVNSWPASRTDADIRRDQQARLQRDRARQQQRQREFQRLDDQLNRLGI